jgi:mono/diheme cytochrome c family protein
MLSKQKLLAGLLAALAASAAGAQDEGAGAREYMAACASCHGETGKGAGPLAELMTVPVPDLTTLTAENDGTFPMLEVIQVIDGRTGIRGHGYPMPVWGDRFKAREMRAGAYAAELATRGRILSIALHLESLQE